MALLYRTTRDETPRLFKSDFLEFFTRVHPSVPLFLYLPLIFFLVARAYFRFSLPGYEIALLLTAGVFLWSLTEYLLHRFVFHFKAQGERSRRIVYLFHGIHHDYPNDSWRLVMPPAVSLPVAVLLVVFSLGNTPLQVLFSGFGLGYLVYDMVHYAVHHFALKGAWGQALKRYHLKHHYQDPVHGFGVSSPWWDKVFRTSFR
jgi:sterol desaturase/sphingolipid hydroxylase (fatty acid hydroxylase superfamily)